MQDQMSFGAPPPERPARLTTREKRERRAERLRGWADAREAKQPARSQAARADEAATGIPFGQPIFVGHHSERRHRNAIAKIDRAMAASVENAQKATSMAGRADEIERQLNAAIYDDDPDALERLQAKLEALEAKRERMKAANAAYRKEHRAELKAETNGYLRGQMVPWPSYAISNIGGVITTTRQRIARLSRPVEAERGRVLVTRYPGECRKCGRAVERGETVRYFKRAKTIECEEC